MRCIKGEGLEKMITPEMLSSKAGEKVRVSACIHKIKDMGGFAFILLRTGRYVFQSVYDKALCGEDISHLTEGAYIDAKGAVREEPRAPHGVEIRLDSVGVLSTPAAAYPVKVSARRLGCSLDAAIKYRVAGLRNPYERAVLKLSEGVCEGFRAFMMSEGFTEIHSPKIVSAGAEGGANLFKLKYFEREAFLAQSPQVYKQTCVAVYDRVFEVGPVFRAEKHSSPRHLNEYTGLDFEMGYISGMDDIMKLETAMLRHVMAHLSKNYQNEIKITGAQIPEIAEIPAVTFLEAIEILGGGAAKHDLEPEDEVRLCEYAKEKHGSDFLFVTHYPAAKRPFYSMDDPEDSRLALSFDLLFRGIEITTGGQRIHDYGAQIKKMEKMGLDPADFEDYLDIHKYGMPPHGGLGIGLERLVMKLAGLQNVKMATLFPRDINHLTP